MVRENLIIFGRRLYRIIILIIVFFEEEKNNYNRKKIIWIYIGRK